MSSQNALNAAIYSKLTAGTALTSLLAGTTSIYFLQAPDNSSLPYVEFSCPSELDQNLIPTRMKDIVLRVQAVASTPALAGTLDAQMDAILNEASLTITGWTNLWMRRENGFQTVITDQAGVRYYVSGADYRVELTK